MIIGEPFEYSDDIRDYAIMFALEAQWVDTSLCRDKAEYNLHNQSFRALGEYYRKIGARTRKALRMKKLIQKYRRRWMRNNSGRLFRT
jgi:hypothetical protein